MDKKSIAIFYRIKEIQKKILFFELINSRSSLKNTMENYDEIISELVNLDVPDEQRKGLIENLNEAKKFINLLEEVDFEQWNSDKRKENELLAILSKTSQSLNKVLIRLQESIGIQ